MASESNRKLSILYTLKVLQDYTDDEHYLTQTEIAQKIEQLYGMSCERKSISFNIKSLQDFGYEIIELKRKGVYLAQRTLEPSEISFVVDAMFSSKSINGKQAKDISQKIYNLLSIYQRKKYNYVYKADEISRANNKQLFYNIDIINEAIEKNKQIIFNYNRYDIDGNLVSRKDGKTYLVNPYFLVNSQGRYYLVCNYDYFDDLANYKVEQITNIKLVDNEIKPITKLKGYENGLDISKYTNEHIYMLEGKTINAKIKLGSQFEVNYIYDWFGKNAKVYCENDIYYADITANENAIKYWCMQYGDCVELVAPQEMRNEIIKLLNNMTTKYRGVKNGK